MKSNVLVVEVVEEVAEEITVYIDKLTTSRRCVCVSVEPNKLYKVTVGSPDPHSRYVGIYSPCVIDNRFWENRDKYRDKELVFGTVYQYGKFYVKPSSGSMSVCVSVASDDFYWRVDIYKVVVKKRIVEFEAYPTKNWFYYDEPIELWVEVLVETPEPSGRDTVTIEVSIGGRTVRRSFTVEHYRDLYMFGRGLVKLPSAKELGIERWKEYTMIIRAIYGGSTATKTAKIAVLPYEESEEERPRERPREEERPPRVEWSARVVSARIVSARYDAQAKRLYVDVEVEFSEPIPREYAEEQRIIAAVFLDSRWRFVHATRDMAGKRRVILHAVFDNVEPGTYTVTCYFLLNYAERLV